MQRIAIALDTETTDLLAPELAPVHVQPFITEYSLIKFDMDNGEILEEMNSLVNIPIPVPDHIVRITNITDDMLAEEDPFEDHIDKIIEFCDGVDTYLGQNIMFDLEVIKHNFRRHECEDYLPNFKNKICTIEMSYPISKRRMKLGLLYSMATGKELENAHRARHDVLATITVYRWLIEQGF